MSAWDGLMATALVGTERRPVPPDVLAAVAGALEADLPPGPPERAVLAAAGVLGAYRRSGWAPPRREGTVPDASPPDDRPLASATATQLLELLLDGQVTVPGGTAFLAAEWLERAATAGRRPPERLLPRVLAAATADRSLRAAALATGGPRLGWLAGRNPEWAWAAPAPAPAGSAPPAPAGTQPDGDAAARWATGGREARLLVFTALRAARPDQARALAESTWPGENARDRAAVVEAMAAGLGPDDEPFLEAALDDRSRGVREAAARLLAALPTSRLAARMADRLRPLATTGGRLRRRLEVALPAEPDPAARRDGMVDDGAPPGTGLRSWWLTQLVAATPLGFWSEHLGLDATAVARMAESVEVRQGLALAARRQRDARWAAALLRHQPDPSLLGVLPPGETDAALDPLLGAFPDGRLAELLGAAPGPWSAATSRKALARLRAATTTGPLRQSLEVLAARLHPWAAADVERWVDDLNDDDAARRLVRGLAHALSIRRTIAQELA